MTQFNPIKALGEEITGLLEVQKVIIALEHRAESDLSRAELELNGARKMSGFVAGELARKQMELRKLMDEQAQ